MASIWRRLTSSPDYQLDEDASRMQSSLRSRCEKKDLHRRRSLAGLFTTSPPSKEPDQNITTITCEERIHYPMYNPRDPRHNIDALACDSKGKGFWATYGRSVRSRFQGSTKSGTVSPNIQQRNSRRSIRSSFAYFTSSPRLMKRFSRSEATSKPPLSSIWEPQSAIQKVACKLLPDKIDDSQPSGFPEAPGAPGRYLLPSLPSMSSGLMSPLELEACTTGAHMEQETSYPQNHGSGPQTFSRPLQPFHILRNAVASMSSAQPAVQARPKYANISNNRSEMASSPISITSKRPPLNHQQARMVKAREDANMPTLLSKQMHSRSSTFDDKQNNESQIPKILTNGAKPESLLNLGQQCLETRMQPLREVSSGISQPSTATDSEFGVEMYRTSSPHRYSSTTESDAVLSSWLSSLSSIAHPRDNTDISGSTLCRSPPSSTRHTSRAGQAALLSTLDLLWQDGLVQGFSGSKTRHCSEPLIRDKPTTNKHEETPSKSNSLRPKISTKSVGQENFDNPSFLRNIHLEVGRTLELANTPFNLHMKSEENLNPVSNSCREKSDLKPGFNKGDFWPGSIDSRIRSGGLKQPPNENRPDSPIPSGHGEVQFGIECPIIPVTHPEETRAPPSYSGNTRPPQRVSQDATDRKITSTCKTSWIPGVKTPDCGTTSMERRESQVNGDRGSKPSSTRKNDSNSGSGSGSGDSGQSDPLTSSTAGTSVVDFTSDKNLTTKTNGEQRTASPKHQASGIKSR
ncbi:hypothetical protein ACJ73_07001 [Blastomyces percursus]|uniref:Uncharacterized protein n=1 Tax=Blastomyces percursus TaxID=1658174 RepID=A0A1J9PZB5_9EURO|nr:hypothetical protein ACJ73_07001 [Blastomyces percursus]